MYSTTYERRRPKELIKCEKRVGPEKGEKGSKPVLPLGYVPVLVVPK